VEGASGILQQNTVLSTIHYSEIENWSEDLIAS